MVKKVVNTSGKRKTAVARASVQKGTGLVRINKIPVELYEPEISRWKIMEPLKIASSHMDKINVDVNVKGGGFMSQASAIRTAIAKGLVDFTGDPSLKIAFLDKDRSLLVSDSRRKEPKKPLGRGARKKRQKSYRWDVPEGNAHRLTVFETTPELTEHTWQINKLLSENEKLKELYEKTKMDKLESR